MEGKTHLLTAFTVYSVINTTLVNSILVNSDILNKDNILKSPDIALISLGAILAGSIIPDMDLPGSTAGSKITLVNMKMVKIIVNIVLLLFGAFIVYYAGNKYALYGGGAILALLLLSYKSVTNKTLYILRRTIQILMISSLIFAFFIKHEILLLYFAAILTCYFFSKHRGLSHSLLLSIAAAFCIYKAFTAYGYTLYGYYGAAYFFLGSFLHIFINDYLTDKGVPGPLYPLLNILKLPFCIRKYGLSKKAFKESFKINRVRFFFTFSTGSTFEGFFSIICVAITIVSFFMAFKSWT